MSSVILSGLTTITTISLFEEYNISSLIEDIKSIGCWFHSSLPDNKLIKALIYSAGTVLFVRSLPILLRNTDFFSYYNREILYFHRSANHKQILEYKRELLQELQNGEVDLPLFDEKLVILEMNIGGGTNLSYYPEGSYLIGTDFLDSKEKLENNSLLGSKIILSQYIETYPEELNSVADNSVSCVVSFHSLCSARNVSRALAEIKRVLLPHGKLYFIEHTLETKRFSKLWIKQANFRVSMFIFKCCMNKIEDYLEKAEFSELVFKKDYIDTSMFLGPLLSVAPHVYGYAKK